MIPGDKVNNDFANWNLQIDLCFYLSEIKPTSCHCSVKQTNFSREERWVVCACCQSRWFKYCNNAGQANYWICITRIMSIMIRRKLDSGGEGSYTI